MACQVIAPKRSNMSLGPRVLRLTHGAVLIPILLGELGLLRAAITMQKWKGRLNLRLRCGVATAAAAKIAIIFSLLFLLPSTAFANGDEAQGPEDIDRVISAPHDFDGKPVTLTGYVAVSRHSVQIFSKKSSKYGISLLLNGKDGVDDSVRKFYERIYKRPIISGFRDEKNTYTGVFHYNKETGVRELTLMKVEGL